MSAWIPTYEMLEEYWSRFAFVALRRSVRKIPLQVAIGVEGAKRGCRGTMTSRIDRSFLERWRDLKLVVALRGGDPAALDWVNFLAYLLPDIFVSRGLRVEIPLPSGSFGYYVFFGQPGGGGIYGRRELTITPDDAFAYHDLLIADPKPEGVKVADRLMRSAVHLYIGMSLDRIELKAGLSGGGRLWPKYGFRPKTEADWRGCKERIRSNLRGLDESVQQMWGTAVEAVLAVSSPRAIWLISDLSVKIQEHKLGDILLTGTKWHGMLDLEDPETIERLTARLGTV